jgi:hypothetical protein
LSAKQPNGDTLSIIPGAPCDGAEKAAAIGGAVVGSLATLGTVLLVNKFLGTGHTEKSDN